MPLPAHSAVGLLVLIGLAWVISEDRRRFPWRVVGASVVLQLVLAALVLKMPASKGFFVALNDILLALEDATRAGTSFVFGYLGGAEPPFEAQGPGDTFILAFQALPLILVVSALSALLFYWRVLPVIVRGASRALEHTLGIGGALGLGAAANIFVGMVEAPLFVRPYVKDMSRSELFALMTTGLATIAGTMMVLYASIVGEVLPDAMGHILTASLLSAPAAIAVAAIMVPPAGESTVGRITPPQQAVGAMDAVTKGTLQGVQLLINIVALLIVLVALVKLVNIILGLGPAVAGEALTLQRVLGWVMAPLVWLMGIPWGEAQVAGMLMGTKTILNEFLAYLEFARLPGDALSPRSDLIMTYAMCGFANPGSLGILIGGLGTMVPERWEEIVGLGLKAVVGGTLATMMTGAVVGMWI